MTPDGLRVMDSDMHVLEPPDLWQRYIDPAFAHVAPVGLTEMPRDMRVRVKSHVMLKLGPVRPRAAGAKAWSSEQDRVFADAERRGWDADSQCHAMDAEGLDQAVLFPSRGLFVLGLDLPQVVGLDGLEPEFAAAIARAYNDWLHDFCRRDPARLLGAGMVAPHDVTSAVAETRRCAETLGMKTVFLAPGCVGRRPWHDPYYDPLWAECERLGIALTFHGGGQTNLKPDFSLEVLDKLMMWHTFNQPLGIMAVAVSLTAGGVLERFPQLRVGLLEGNCGWAPWLLQRLDEHWEWVGAYEAPELTMKPSEYFRRNCYLSVEADEQSVKYYVDAYGDENLVFSTDYPHADSKYPRSVATFRTLPLSPDSQRKILWDNCRRLYGLPVGP
ncbi:MAG TPA: amidohydrolase family protein [Candidatus Limnocylindria bacterium]|nr:amidohydrolase family protein [Candidatus Limnocylindria bacterium]